MGEKLSDAEHGKIVSELIQHGKLLQMFGTAAIDDWVESCLEATKSEPLDFVKSHLSDAQEMIDNGDSEGARKAINRCKYIIDKYPVIYKTDIYRR